METTNSFLDHPSALPLSRFYHPVLRSKDLKSTPIATQIGNENIVLFRGESGLVSAIQDRCAHRFTPLSAGKVTKDGKIKCPYHGWAFDKEGKAFAPTAGEVKNCSVRRYFTYESYDYIWISSKEDAPLPVLPSEDFILMGAYALGFDGALPLVLDNFSEDEHFPYVHSWFGWDEAGSSEVEFDWKISQDEVHVKYFGPQRDFSLMRMMLIQPGSYFQNHWIAKYSPPNISYTVQFLNRDGSTKTGAVSRVVIYFVPNGPTKTTLHVFQFSKFLNKRLNYLLPFLKSALIRNTKKDLQNDVELIARLKNVPTYLQGMRLGKYDGPVFHGRRLLEKVYFGVEAVSTTQLNESVPKELSN